MSIERDKALIRDYFAARNHPDANAAAAALDGVLHPDIIDDGACEGQRGGIEGFKEFLWMWRTAFPVFTSQIHEMIAEDDRIATRWSFKGTHLGSYNGMPPTGRRVRFTGMTFNRVEDGLLDRGAGRDRSGPADAPVHGGRGVTL